MQDNWQVTLASILSMMIYGWSYHEICYKIRGGDVADPIRKSNFTDGKIGWRKFDIRSQESLMRWETVEPSGSGDITGMTQIVYGLGARTVPYEKSLLFRVSLNRGSPEGKPMIRNAYRPWFIKKHIEEIEAIGIERDLAGLPVGWLDPAYMSPDATDDEKAVFTTVKQIVANIKRNEMEGIVFPLLYDEYGHKLIDLTLMNSGGNRQFDIDKTIGRYNQQIAMSVLADFLMLGHEAVGTQALGSSKIELWMMAVESLAKSIAAEINQYAIPRLLKLNGMDTENMPKLVFGSVENVDLGVLGTFIKAMCDAGVIVPDQKLEEMIREIAKLTPIDEETRADMGAGEIPLGVEDIKALMAPDKVAADPLVQTAQTGAAAAKAPMVKPGTNPQAKVQAPVKASGA
jgi:hypothetical protein